MDSKDPKYSYNRFGSKGARVGQAASDILSKDQPVYTVGEMLEGMGPKFAAELEKAVNDNLDKYKSPFYVLALTKKEFWATNVVRNWFIPRQSAPYALDMIKQYPHHTKTLYVVNSDKGDIKVAWSLPGHEDCKSIAKTPDSFNKELVDWIRDAYDGKLNKDNYNYLFR